MNSTSTALAGITRHLIANNEDDAPTGSAHASNTAAAEIDPVLWRCDVQAKLKVTGETMRRYIRDAKLPKPDVHLTRRTMGWKLSTLRAAGIDLQ